MIEFEPESSETARALGAFLGKQEHERKMKELEAFFQSLREEIFEKAKDRKAMSEETKPSAGVPEGCLPFDLEKAKAGWPVRTRDGRKVWGLQSRWGPGNFPVGGIYELPGNCEMTGTWRLDGGWGNPGSRYPLDLFLAVVETPAFVGGIVDTPAEATQIVKPLEPEMRQQIIDLVAEHFGLRATEAEPVVKTEAGTEEPWAMTPAIDLCLRLLIWAFDTARDKTVTEKKADLARFFSIEEIARANSLLLKGVIPPPMDLEWYRQ
jgi:hypothetical protein